MPKKPDKKKSKKKSKKKLEKNAGKLKDADLNGVAGGAVDEPTASIPLEDLDSRKRPGRVKAL